MIFKAPALLGLIAVIVPALAYLYFSRKTASFLFPSAAFMAGLRPTWRARLRHLPFFLRLVTIVLFHRGVGGAAAGA